jgi:hypothetical protein
MSTQRIESAPFRGGSVPAYQAARRHVREQAAHILGMPISRVRIAPGALTLEKRVVDRWIGACQDVVDEHQWRVRHYPRSDELRLVIWIRT